jgi:hypothetical protein
MKKLFIILAVVLASCTPDYDDLEPALYDVRITRETKVSIVSPKSGYVFKTTKSFRVVADERGITQTSKDKLVEAYPEGVVTMHEPTDDGLFRETEYRTYHEITRN